MKENFKKNKKKFADFKKFPTFAVPNETGAIKRSLMANKKKIETVETETETGTLRRPVETQGEIARYRRRPRGIAGKFIKEISFIKAQRGEDVYCKVHTAKLFSLGRFLQTIQLRTDNQF